MRVIPVCVVLLLTTTGWAEPAELPPEASAALQKYLQGPGAESMSSASLRVRATETLLHYNTPLNRMGHQRSPEEILGLIRYDGTTFDTRETRELTIRFFDDCYRIEATILKPRWGGNILHEKVQVCDGSTVKTLTNSEVENGRMKPRFEIVHLSDRDKALTRSRFAGSEQPPSLRAGLFPVPDAAKAQAVAERETATTMTIRDTTTSGTERVFQLEKATGRLVEFEHVHSASRRHIAYTYEGDETMPRRVVVTEQRTYKGETKTSLTSEWEFCEWTFLPPPTEAESEQLLTLERPEGEHMFHERDNSKN